MSRTGLPYAENFSKTLNNAYMILEEVLLGWSHRTVQQCGPVKVNFKALVNETAELARKNRVNFQCERPAAYAPGYPKNHVTVDVLILERQLRQYYGHLYYLLINAWHDAYGPKKPNQPQRVA